MGVSCDHGVFPLFLASIQHGHSQNQSIFIHQAGDHSQTDHCIQEPESITFSEISDWYSDWLLQRVCPSGESVIQDFGDLPGIQCLLVTALRLVVFHIWAGSCHPTNVMRDIDCKCDGAKQFLKVNCKLLSNTFHMSHRSYLSQKEPEI